MPQFYLRYFSQDGKRVNLFNFSRGRTITDASIKHQCSRHNFYDFAPQLERAFSDMEGGAASVIRGIKTAADIPGQQSGDWYDLLVYIVFQKFRTTNAGRLNDASMDYLGRLYLENSPALEGIDPATLKLKSTHSVALPLSLAHEILPCALDLRGHLFINTTDREFITSDDPVVIHNQYCEGITYRGVTGWNCTGLQVFWPISPLELIVLYDPTTYKVGRSHRGATVTRLSDERDVAQLNSLQILNAHHNVYFAGINGLNSTESQCRILGAKRPNARTTFVETEAVETDAGESSAILHTYEPLLPARLVVSKITVRRNRRRIPLHSRAVMYRKGRPTAEHDGIPYGDPPPGRYAVKKITNV
ncbi:MAG: DUF4238 domain-containing protein [Candidatus Tectomicrobia bacterium]|nr:DUF4238 domain-containing protein [Candidatus Tectomicrobia bacterium]